MGNWKSDMERRLKERDEAQAKSEAARKERVRITEQQRSERAFAKNMEKHKRRFKCYICGKQSDGPYYHPGGMAEGIGDSGQVYREPYYDWDDPKNLFRCSICGMWCYERHIGGRVLVCERCFRKGYIPGDKKRPLNPTPMIILALIGATAGAALQNVPLVYGLAIIGLVVGYLIHRMR